MQIVRNRSSHAHESAGGCSEAMLMARDRAVTQYRNTAVKQYRNNAVAVLVATALVVCDGYKSRQASTRLYDSSILSGPVPSREQGFFFVDAADVTCIYSIRTYMAALHFRPAVAENLLAR
ncbi:hypothetical protein [Paraburkholderia aspalathi]|uniref:Uncharacterized protein n=1 Tax=Paraburkholderia aspalathi TaxID=1324617 RepID=A0A1I7BWI2_9BURK|nr:hypothetical protein [Paraburkholderia aspalathi]SFT91566.1 hypothetical protein SAMN05192563_1005193 [Paraburkholderia aspalathi]